MSYSVSCYGSVDGYAIVEHGTDDRRPIREGVPGVVRAMCGQEVNRGEAVPFDISKDRTELAVFVCELSICVACARREQVMNAARAAVVAEGVTLAYGRPL